MLMKKNKLIYFIVGARPNFIKVAPLLRKLKTNKNFSYKLVHTGQHYDKLMSEVFFNDLKIQKPDYNLNVKANSQNSQVAKIMLQLEKKCLEDKPDIIFVFGDVNSTLAASITAKKLGLKLVHYEAGLRSFDRNMPEEINRLICDSISDYFLCTEKTAISNLLKEGIPKKKIFHVGNLMIDSLNYHIRKTQEKNINDYDYAVLTMHRPSNIDIKDNLEKLILIFNTIAEKIKIIFPVHPRTKLKLDSFKIHHNIKLIEPLGYTDFCLLWTASKFVITDSGGIQEETTALKIPCLTIRENTERPITVEIGSNTIVGINGKVILKLVDKVLNGEYKKSLIPEFWDGKSSERIIEVIKSIL